MSRSTKSGKKTSPKKVAKKATKRKRSLNWALEGSHKRRTFNVRKKIPVNDLLVNKAEHVEGYILLITFSNGVARKVDFSPFLNNTKARYLSKYKKIDNFKSFKIEEGNVVWGKNWDLIFPIKQLFRNSISV